jgi:hypothetical protein
MITLSDAVHRTGLPRRTLQRRVDAYIRAVQAGQEASASPYAIVGQRLDDAAESRCVSAVDAERVRLQCRRELGPEVDAATYAAMIIKAERDGGPPRH